MLTNENYKGILRENEFTLILIAGGGCAHCTTMFPIVNEVQKKIPELNVFHVDVNETNNHIVKAYEIEVVPTMLFLYRGELISRVKGYQPQEIMEIYIDSKMQEYKRNSQVLS